MVKIWCKDTPSAISKLWVYHFLKRLFINELLYYVIKDTPHTQILWL